jgi:hypothetical protein
VTEQQKFEAWATAQYHDTRKDDAGRYRSTIAQATWEAWQARAVVNHEPRNGQTYDERVREVSLATIEAKLLGTAFIMIMGPDCRFKHVPAYRIDIKPERCACGEFVLLRGAHATGSANSSGSRISEHRRDRCAP